MRILRFNESKEYNEVQYILNIASDEGYIVNFGDKVYGLEKSQGYTHAFSITHGPELGCLSIPKSQKVSFLRMCQNIETRLKQIVETGEMNISIKHKSGNHQTEYFPIDGIMPCFMPSASEKAANFVKDYNIEFASCVVKI